MGHKVENTSLTPTVFKKEAYAVKFPLPMCMCVQERGREREWIMTTEKTQTQ